jgi:hypothetical protein
MPRYEDDDLDEEGLEEEEAEPFEDWDRPSWWQSLLPLVAALIVGVIVGLVLGAQVFTASGGAGNATTESYLVLASELYRQGEDIETVRAHLDAIGIHSPAQVLLQQAADYKNSTDLSKKRQSESLQQLGDAFLYAGGGRGTAVVVAQAADSTPTKTGSPAVTPVTGIVGAAQTPTAAKTAVATTIAPTAVATKAPAAAPTATKAPTVANGKTARITSSGGEGAKLRKQPTTSSDVVSSLNNGTQVTVLDTVNGEAIDEAEPRWYKVQYKELTGYVYFKLISLGE